MNRNPRCPLHAFICITHSYLLLSHWRLIACSAQLSRFLFCPQSLIMELVWHQYVLFNQELSYGLPCLTLTYLYSPMHLIRGYDFLTPVISKEKIFAKYWMDWLSGMPGVTLENWKVMYWTWDDSDYAYSVFYCSWSSLFYICLQLKIFVT